MIFKVWTLNFEYFTTKISAQDDLNINNLEKISKSSLNFLEKKYKKQYFYIYKRNLLARWHQNNKENSELYFLRLRKIIRKLGINLTEKENQYILTLESEELTNRRAFKTLEYPFSNSSQFKGKKCHFIYKDVKFYQQSGKNLKLVSNIDLYFIEDQMVFFDRKANGLVNIIEYNKIRDIEKKTYGIHIYAGLKTSLLRYGELNVIYITLIRVIRKFNSNHIILKKNNLNS